MLKRNLLLSLLSALLLSLPWFSHFSGLLLLIAWVPLLALEHSFEKRQSNGCWKYYATTFVLWNIITTHWIANATLWGAVAAILGNALQMFLIFALFRWVKRRTNPSIGYAFFIALWMAWEYFYFNAEISWPWLVLGNGFAKDIRLVQWYEYTGVLGGSLWVLISNILIFRGITLITSDQARTKKSVFNFVLITLIILVPCIFSLIRFCTYKEAGDTCRVVVLQPNIDPYQKFRDMPEQEQLGIMLRQAVQQADSVTDFVIAPETAISNILENNPLQSPLMMDILQFLVPYPQASLIIGTASRQLYPDGERPTYTARKYGNLYYDIFNSAMHIRRFDDIKFYHKSKLVVGVEKLPYPRLLNFLGDWSIKLGGSSGSFVPQAERDTFNSVSQKCKIGVAICYESEYGAFYTEYVQKGANVMAIITNDAWWGNTVGYKQHLWYASLRAIETRRGIARSTNTGISAIINQRGEIVHRTPWCEEASIKSDIATNDYLTFYVKNGDYLGRAAALVLCLLTLYTIYTLWRKRKKLSL